MSASSTALATRGSPPTPRRSPTDSKQPIDITLSGSAARRTNRARLCVGLRRCRAAELINGGTDDVVCHGHRSAQIVVDQLDGIRGKVAAVLDLARPVTLGKQLLRTEGGVLGRQPLQVTCFVGLSRRCDHHGERRCRRHSGDQDAKCLNHDLPPPGETVWLSYPEWASGKTTRPA